MFALIPNSSPISASRATAQSSQQRGEERGGSLMQDMARVQLDHASAKPLARIAALDQQTCAKVTPLIGDSEPTRGNLSAQQQGLFSLLYGQFPKDLMDVIAETHQRDLAAAFCLTKPSFDFASSTLHSTTLPLPTTAFSNMSRRKLYVILHETSPKRGTYDPFVAPERDGVAQAVYGTFESVSEANYNALMYVEEVRAEFDVDICGIPTSITIEGLLQDWGVNPQGDGIILYYRRPDLESPPCRIRVVDVNWVRYSQTLVHSAKAIDSCDCTWCHHHRV
ncbi:hypothetical protein GGR53DRAFT_527171 [Hypoxylon sp. FL1150]|nr:hypothetical protein GGR53DRAFT_527171 [Hypoxylon sp. FL1150]